VDKGTVIRQGPISELLAGAAVEVQVDCSSPERAQAVLAPTSLGERIDVGEAGLAIHLPTGTGRDAIAEINRLLVESGLDVYRLQEIQVSLESWFLEVTSRLGEGE
jgi:hypothetical protein